MKVTPAIVRQEFIGLIAEVVCSSNPSCVGIKGKVINETKNTFVVVHESKKKTLTKNHSVFHFTLPDATIVEIDGRALVGRPEERIKKQIRRVW